MFYINQFALVDRLHSNAPKFRYLSIISSYKCQLNFQYNLDKNDLQFTYLLNTGDRAAKINLWHGTSWLLVDTNVTSVCSNNMALKLVMTSSWRQVSDLIWLSLIMLVLSWTEWPIFSYFWQTRVSMSSSMTLMTWGPKLVCSSNPEIVQSQIIKKC